MSNLEAAVQRSLEAMTWLTDADQATRDLALTYARRIDETGDVYIGPHLINVLKALGGTPEARQTLGVATKEIRGRLADLRAARTDRATPRDSAAS